MPTSFPHFSRQESVSDSRDKTEAVAETETETERDAAQTSEPKPPAGEDEKTERPETTEDEKVKEVNDETSKPESQPAQEPLSTNILSGNLQEIIEKTIGPENTTVDDLQLEKEEELQQEQINVEKPQIEGEVEREVNPEGKEGISNMDSGFKEQEEGVTEEPMLIDQPERETYCEEEEDRQTGEHQENQAMITEEGTEEELRGGIEQEEQVVETDMIQMQVEEEEGMLEEEPEVGVEGVTETEEAVNTLKDIMALQPTEILGLPEPDEFDYGGEYVEYFEGGVYEDDDLENMNNDGTYIGEGGEGISAREQEQMEQMALEHQEMSERIQEPENMEQEADNAEQVETGERGEADAGMDMVDGAVEGMGQQEAEFVGQDHVEGGGEQEIAGEQGENHEEYNQMMERNTMEEMEVERDEELEEGIGGEERRQEQEVSPESSPPKATEKEEKESEEQPSTVRQTRNSTEDDSTRNESDNNPEEAEGKTSKPTTTDTKTDNKEQKQEVTATPDTSQPQGSTAETGKTTQTTPGTVKKPKRHKRGLERELEQLDYWGRRQERDAKRRRRTISSKLLGSIEEAEYLTWADLLKSFLPSSLLNVNVDERNKAKTPQPQPSVSQGTGVRADTQEGDKSNMKEEEDVPKLLPDPNTQGSSSNGKSASSKAVVAMEVDKEPGVVGASQPGDKEAKVKEEEDAEAELRRKRKEIILSPLSSEEEQVEAFLLCHEENGGILHLLQLCLITLYKKHSKTWPSLPAKLFTEIYPRVRSALSLQEDWARLHEDAMLSLTHWELVLSLYQVAKQDTLHRSHMLEQVVDNYTCNRYQMVAELLTSIFHEPPPKARPGVTLPTRQTQLVILMDSLLKLKDFKGVLSWGALSLAEALKRYNRAEAEEEKNRWAKTLMIITDSINTTLVKDITYLESLGSEKLLELVNTLIQVLVVQLEKPQSVQVLPLETLTPWILLHRMLSHEEKLLRQAESKQEAAAARGGWRCKGIVKWHKHLRDHGVPQIALCWERALQLYRYYCPTQLPDFQSSQIPSITDDVASFLKR
ncbi:hypothetical protein E2C01_025195 [Portunus trituberculatus]|uniref:Uncharacterized protein n=1 Tax=Portunus trituberculatus TaxID=210409 RepID=A0A5B7EET0_PORTR|nr:hypothetical protein [Portunus trituberculatus]